MSEKSNLYKVDHESLKEFSRIVDGFMKKTDWKSAKSSFANTSSSNLDVAHSVMTGGKEETISIANFAINISKKGFAMTEGVNKAYLTVREAFMLGSKISELFDKASNLDVMQKERGLSQQRQSEFREKATTSAAIMAFVSAYYVVHELSNYKDNELESIHMEFEGIPELSLVNSSMARKCVLFYYGSYLEKSGKVHDELTFLKMTLLYFQAIIDEIKAKENAFKYIEIFKSSGYKLEDSEFSIQGFEFSLPGHTSHVEFNRVEWGDIVGNVESKHSAKRSIMGLMCYDPTTQRNPLKDLGGFFRTKLVYGPPGTGKSMEIAAIASELSDRCKELGIPFLFHPFPDNIVSTYQGGSAERAIAWFNPILNDPKHIIFAPIDDAENNLQDRSSQGVSAGVSEVVGVFLRMTEGAYAIDRGNNLINLYTNLPEKIDKAVLSRVQGRTHMAGAKTEEDFLDQDYIGLIKPIEKLIPGFTDFSTPKSYKYMSAQSLTEKIKEEYERKSTSKVELIAEILEKARKKHEENSPEFFAYLDTQIASKFIYTSRDKRNIQSAVKTRIFDFDFPDEWLNDPLIFFKKDYDEKKSMIIDLIRSSLQGKSFVDIYLEEAVFYFDNLAQISNKDFERKVEQTIDHMRIQAEARRRTS